jgi:aminotransferase
MPVVPRFSKALQAVPTSGIRRIANAAQIRRDRGLPVYAFHLGEPDFDTPEPIKQAAIEALQQGKVHYAPNAGIPELRTAVAQHLSQHYRIDLDSSSVIVTIGACEALTLAVMGILETGDEILVPTPCWPNYLHLPELLGAQVVEVATRAEDGFRISARQLAEQIGPRTRAILINSPNNPTGAIISREELSELVQLARSHNLWLISDEIYQDFTYGSGTHVSVLELCQPGDPVLYVGGFAKSFAMTGWRLGYLVTHPEYVQAFLKLHQYLVTSATTFAQWGALKAFETLEAVEQMKAQYIIRRQRVLEALHQSRFQYVVPDGGFYVFAQIPENFEDADVFCEQMLLEHGLGFIPGSVFGEGHERWFRICFAASTEEVTQGMSQLVRAFPG